MRIERLGRIEFQLRNVLKESLAILQVNAELEHQIVILELFGKLQLQFTVLDQVQVLDDQIGRCLVSMQNLHHFDERNDRFQALTAEEGLGGWRGREEKLISFPKRTT